MAGATSPAVVGGESAGGESAGGEVSAEPAAVEDGVSAGVSPSVPAGVSAGMESVGALPAGAVPYTDEHLVLVLWEVL